MADIFVSYTSSDREWAFWIGLELRKLGHAPRIHEWEISAGGNIVAWMEERHHQADHILCVVSPAYLAADYSSWERQAAQWAAASRRPNFALPVLVEDCEVSTLFAHIKRCDLFGIGEEAARTRLANYLAPATQPIGPVGFPGSPNPPQVTAAKPTSISFPGAVSNIPIRIPEHFLGRDEAVADIDAALMRKQGRVAITTLHGLRGVGKTTLAAAWAEMRRADYRATWWIRAQTEATMRADLVALGVRLGWVAADAKEAPALEGVREKLRQEGEGLLLIFDNAIDAEAIKPYLPLGGAARVLITSNSQDWRQVAAPVEIRVWSKETGADYLIARTGRDKDRADAEALSLALGGLPLAHEQAAAYCARLHVSFAEYRRRFDADPAKWLDDAKHAPSEYGLTVAKTFGLAIDEAAKLHPAAEDLIVRLALLAAEPIPLFVLREGREQFGEPLASLLAGDGLDEALAALRTFALIDEETIADEREPEIETEAIRLHRLVRAVAAGRRLGEAREAARREWVEVLGQVYPEDVYNDPTAWPRARRLDAIAMELVGGAARDTKGEGTVRGALLTALGQYRQAALATYSEARPLFERALAIYEQALGSDNSQTATTLNNLGLLLQDQGELSVSRRLFERALSIRETAFGPEHPHTASSFNNLAGLLQDQGDLPGARRLFERALEIREIALGPKNPATASSLNNLALLLKAEGDLERARPLLERSLAIYENAYGPKHHDTATSLHNLASLRQEQGDIEGANSLFERALAILKEILAPEHPFANRARANLARLRLAQGAPAEALPLAQAALAAHEKVLRAAHPWTQNSARVAADALDALGRGEEAAGVRARFGV